MTTWQAKLTKAELRHLRENGILTLAAMRRQVTHIRASQAKDYFYCHDCLAIARKLGLLEEVEG